MIKTFPKKQLILLVGDVILIIASFYLAPILRFGIFLNLFSVFDWPDLSAMIIYLLFFYVFDFYNLEERFTTAAYALRFLAAILIADFFVPTLFYVFNVRPYATIILILNTLLIFSFCLAWRFLYDRWDKQIQKVFKVLIIGAGWAGSDLYQMLTARSDFQVLGLLDDDPEKWGMTFEKLKTGSHFSRQNMNPSSILPRVLGGSDRLPELLDRNEVDIVIVAITHRMNQELNKLIVQAKMRGIMVFGMPTFYERVLGKIPVQHVSDLWFVYTHISGVRRSIYNLKVKRIFDLMISLIGLLAALPLILLIALAIKCDSPGPVLHIQRRIGCNGKPFDLIKFRSMIADMENDRQFAGQKNDPRITRVGRVLRISRLDEIPQMWNVIQGDMSFIGPRALIEDEVNAFAGQIPYFSLRHSIRPGITGWAQINYPHGASEKDALEKLQYDLFYIKNLSPLLDLHILLRTFYIVLYGRGAR